MHKSVLFVLLMVCALPVFGQIPQQLNYQGIARKGNGDPIAYQKITVRLSIIDSANGGVIAYQERKQVTTNYVGLFSISIGGPGAYLILGNFTTINWKTGLKYIKLEVDPTANDQFLLAGMTLLNSVPYSLAAYPVGIAGGDLTGNYPDPVISNNAITQSKIADGSVSKSKLSNTLQQEISGFLKYMDTSVMLQPYLRKDAQSGTDISGKENVSNKSNLATLGNSDVLYPTQYAVKTYVDQAVSNVNIADATAVASGKIRLAGDLTGSATTPVIANGVITSSKIGDLQVTDAKIVSVSSSKISGILASSAGGTGVNNNGKQLTMEGNLSLKGGNDLTLNTNGNTNLQLPAAGMLATIDGTEALSNKTVNGIQLTQNSVGFSIAGGVESRQLDVSGHATVSGNNTGDQLINLTGDISGSGTGNITTTIEAGKITNAMLAGNIPFSKLIGTDITAVGTVTSGVWNAGAVTSSGAIQGTSINGLSLTPKSNGFMIGGGEVVKNLTVQDHATVSGVNTGDQLITLTGDVTGSGTGSFLTSIGNGKVTNQMLAGSIAASKLIGTDITTVGTITSGVWNGGAISANGDITGYRFNGLTITNDFSSFRITGGYGSSRTLTLNNHATISGVNTGDQVITLTGDVTGSGTGSFQTTIGNGKVTAAMLAGSIPSSKLVGTDIATVGTITSGVWNAGAVTTTGNITGAKINGLTITPQSVGFTISGGTASRTLTVAENASISAPHYIGESYGGGIVFYVYDNGQHGLIASTEDLYMGHNYGLIAPWAAGAASTKTQAVADGIRAGLINTQLIVAKYGAQADLYPAYSSLEYSRFQDEEDYTLFGDWYLPSRKELMLLWQQRNIVGNFDLNSYYWTSSEFEADKAWAIPFNTGVAEDWLKVSGAKVRVIRAF